MFIIGILISLFFFLIANYLFRSKCLIMNAFKKGNVIVFGAKGKGKDLIFQYVISERNKERYFSKLVIANFL